MQVTEAIPLTWNGFVWTDHVLTDDEVAQLKAAWHRQWEAGQMVVLGPPVVYSTELEMTQEMAETIQQAFATRLTRTIGETIARLDSAIANVRRYA